MNANTSQLRTSTIIVEFSAGTWTARKMDRKVTEEVNQQKRSAAKAGRVYKSMLPGVEALDKIVKYTASVRNWLYANSKPWSDSGQRLVTVDKYINEVAPIMDARGEEFWALTESFLDQYPLLISAQAFALGDLFDRDEYPGIEQVRSKFHYTVSYLPIPDAADFRLDLEETSRTQLLDRFQQDVQQREQRVVEESRDALVKHLKHVIDRLGYAPDGTPNKFKATLIDNLANAISDARQFNLTKDSALQALADESERVIRNVDAGELRKNHHVRSDVLAQAKGVVDAFGI
jgi:hypothetical protein